MKRSTVASGIALSAALILTLSAPAFSDTGKWRTKKEDSPLATAIALRLELDAEPSAAWPETINRPALVIRCKDKKVTAFVRVGASLRPERSEFNRYTVSVKFDEAAAYVEKVGPSTNRKAFFFKEVTTGKKTFGGILARMMKSRRMQIRFTPFNSPPVATMFDLAGMAEAIRPLAEACDVSHVK